MAATIGFFAASMLWINGTSGGPDRLLLNSLMSAPVRQNVMFETERQRRYTVT